MKTKTSKQTYEAPETSVDFMEMERCILSVIETKKGLQDMDENNIYDEDF